MAVTVGAASDSRARDMRIDAGFRSSARSARSRPIAADVALGVVAACSSSRMPARSSHCQGTYKPLDHQDDEVGVSEARPVRRLKRALTKSRGKSRELAGGVA